MFAVTVTNTVTDTITATEAMGTARTMATAKNRVMATAYWRTAAGLQNHLLPSCGRRA